MDLSQNIFFEIWSILLDQLKDKSRPEDLEKLLGFSCFENPSIIFSYRKPTPIESLLVEYISKKLMFIMFIKKGSK